MSDTQVVIGGVIVNVNIIKEPYYVYGVVEPSGKITNYEGYSGDHERATSRIMQKYSGKEVIGPFFGDTPNDADKGYFAALHAKGINFWDTIFGTYPPGWLKTEDVETGRS